MQYSVSSIQYAPIVYWSYNKCQSLSVSSLTLVRLQGLPCEAAKSHTLSPRHSHSHSSHVLTLLRSYAKKRMLLLTEAPF